MSDGVVEGQPVRNIAPGAVDVDRDGPGVVVGELTQPLDGDAGGVLLDVPDEINVPEAVRLLFSDNLLNRVDQFL